VAEYVVGVDGGNSKTDLVLATTTGRVLSQVRGPGTRPHRDGMAATVRKVADLLERARTEARLPTSAPIAVGTYFMANLDVPVAEEEAAREIAALGLSEKIIVGNDTLAVLHAGPSDGWGVAVVVGAGINALGVRPDGTDARFLALGEVTGDWGGGYAVGLAGLGAAVRAGDGRGAQTVLREAVASHFGLADVEEVALAIHEGRLPAIRLHGLAPVVLAAAEGGDEVAAAIVHRLADEVVTMVGALLRRLDLESTRTPVVLGGGVLQPQPVVLMQAIRDGLAANAPLAEPTVLDVPPVAGALLDALGVAGADAAARALARRSVRAVP
jgi:N-acetylglucosamine kinase-like BadF-type ATPase